MAHHWIASASAGSSNLPAWIGGLTAAAVAVSGLLWWAARHAWRLSNRITHFLDSYFGQPARDGLAPRPGMEARIETLSANVGRITVQVFPNGGTSLRDAVDTLAADHAAHRLATSPQISQLSVDVADMRKRMELFETERLDREGPLWKLRYLPHWDVPGRRHCGELAAV
jgi:hypothetical protein